MTFDPIDLPRLLSVVCGLWFIPHIVSKVTARGGRRGEIVGFFRAAGLRPAGVMVAVAGGVEVLAALGLVLGIYARFAAMLACLYLCIAVLALLRASPALKWIWFDRGIEYPAFWAVIALLVALYPP